MKKRQRRENGVGFLRIQQLPKLEHISHDVAVTHHRSFRFAGGSAGKKQYCFGVPAFFRDLQKRQEQARGNHDRDDPPQDNLAFHSRHQFIEFQDAFGPRKIVEAFDERRR